MILGVALLKVPVRDVVASVSYYEQVLGLQKKILAADYGWAQLDGATVALALYEPGKGGGDRAPGGDVDFHLHHNHLEELLERVRTLHPEAMIHRNDDGSASLEFADPDGNRIKIMAR